MKSSAVIPWLDVRGSEKLPGQELKKSPPKKWSKNRRVRKMKKKKKGAIGMTHKDLNLKI